MVVNYEKEGRIAIFTINRPEVMNAINRQARIELNEAMVNFNNDSGLWVGILTGAGDKAFSAGADITEMRGKGSRSTLGPIAGIEHALDSKKPMIAAINGYCLGGGLELALQCDIRIAAEHARLGQPEILRGLIPGGGGSQRLPRMLPWCKAAEILLIGKPIDAQEAYRTGLVNKVVPLDKLISTAKEWAKAICEAAPLAVRTTKEAMFRGYDMSLNDGLALEQKLLREIRVTEDFTEGTRAFVEKRKPDYKAR